MSVETVTIERLGLHGDGVAPGPYGPVHVPFTLPGETVSIAVNKTEGTVMSQRDFSPARQTPPCRHFGPEGKNGTCGGCNLQHANDETYHAFKRSIVVDALKSKALPLSVEPLVIARPGERRRAVLTVRRLEKELLLGYSQAGSHHIVNIEECPIASPGIVRRLATIRTVASSMAVNADPFRVVVLETLSGLDLAFEGIKGLSDRQRRMAIETVLTLPGIARLSLNGEIFVEPQKPMLDFGGTLLCPPAGGFTQATRQAEDAMTGLVLTHLKKCKRVADLFSGSGTFALRLARQSRVHAVEGEERALKALDAATRGVPGLKPVTTEKRDLFRRPLMASELKVFDGVVFDPPRAGAEMQAKEIAKSGVKRVAAVSCNPMTMVRDLRILFDAGYTIASVTPIDQFLWSPHVEAVALLQK